HLGVPYGHGRLLNREPGACASVVDEDVQLAKGGDGGLHDLLPLLFAGDIVPHKQGLPATGADLLGSLEAHLLLDIGQHHPGTFAGEEPCCRPAKAHELSFDTRGSAGDQCHFPCQSHRLFPRRWSSQYLSPLLSVAQYTLPWVATLPSAARIGYDFHMGVWPCGHG